MQVQPEFLLASRLLYETAPLMARVASMKDIFDRLVAGRRLVICTGPCCDSTGDATKLLEGLRAELVAAELKSDTLTEASCVRRSCLGKCTGEPLAYVDPEGIWYHKLSVVNLVRILREHVLDHRTIPELVFENEEERC
jgi:(2Fe-2S) ferredoxin